MHSMRDNADGIGAAPRQFFLAALKRNPSGACLPVARWVAKRRPRGRPGYIEPPFRRAQTAVRGGAWSDFR